MNFQVSGMSCASCASNVNKAVRKVKNVKDCNVNLLTGLLTIDGNPNKNDVMNAVKKLGFGITLKEDDDSQIAQRHKSSDVVKTNTTITASSKVKQTEVSSLTSTLIKRLVFSFIFWVPLMYFSMIHMLFHQSLGAFFENNAVAASLLQCFLTLAIILINNQIIMHGIKGALHKVPNMDTLVTLGALMSFVYSVATMFVMTSLATEEEKMSLMMSGLYFESAGTILLLITLGKLLDSLSRGKTTSALNDLKKLYSENITLIVDGDEKTVPIDTARVDDTFIVRPGESIPLDGVIVEGTSAINEASLTGESVPRDKKEGDEIYQGTILIDGCITCRVTKIGKDTILSKIINMVENASATSLPIAKTVDKVSSVFIPAVILVSLITLVLQLIINRSFSFALVRAVSVLVVSCPCALGLATPLAIMVSTGRAAKKGILFKNAHAIENAGKIKTIVLDKTGTITKGEMTVSDILPATGVDYNEFLNLAYSLEFNSSHPISIAISKKGEALKAERTNVSDFYTLAGKGVVGFVNGSEIAAGNNEFISEKAELLEDVKNDILRLKNEGKTVVLFSYKKSYFGLIALTDTVRSDSVEAINRLKKMGIKVVMLTGDNREAAHRIAKESAVDDYIAEVLPDEKANVIKTLSKDGPVMMVGDGINDSVALTTATVGVAIKSGSSLAIDSSDVVLMNSSLMSLEELIMISRRTLRRIKENLFWAFLYNVICIPLAAGLFVPLGAIALSPEVAALGMGLSSLLVTLNSLR